MASDPFNTSDKQFRENINFIKDLFYPSLASSQIDLSQWPNQNSTQDMRSPPNSNTLQTLARLANRETGMTPTPTNDNPNSYRSPKIEIMTPKSALNPPRSGSQQHSTPSSTISSVTPDSLQHHVNSSPGDSSGISTGTDGTSDGSSSFHSSHRWAASFPSTPTTGSNSSAVTSSVHSSSSMGLHGQATSRITAESPMKSPILGRSQHLNSPAGIDPMLLSALSSVANEQRNSATVSAIDSSRFMDTGCCSSSEHHLRQQQSFQASPSAPKATSGEGSSTLDASSPLTGLAGLTGDSLTEQQLNELLMTMLYNSYVGGDNSAANNVQLTADDLRQLYSQELLLRLLSQSPLTTANASPTGFVHMLSPLLGDLSSPLMGSGGLSFSNACPASTSSALGSFMDQSVASASAGNMSGSLLDLGSTITSVSSPAEMAAAVGGNTSVSSNVSSLEDVSMMTGFYQRLIAPMMGAIEKAASQYRNSANSVSQKCEVPFNWTGKLPARVYRNATFSRKVFLGGVPWDSTSDDLVAAFNCFGPVSVMWPQKEGNSTVASHGPSKPKGYCYLIFENETSVRLLLNSCARDSNGGDYYKIASPKFRSKDVQVIPWVINDSQFNRSGAHRPDMKKTVFIGALHGMITAEALATIMNDLFENVAFCALDTDKYKYPIGSGRVAFSTQKSYVRAVTANFVDVRTAKFAKTIQIDPYLEDSMCNNCFVHAGVYFCRAFECFRYFCPACWHVWHNSAEILYNHKPLRRTFKAAAAQINSQ